MFSISSFHSKLLIQSPPFCSYPFTRFPSSVYTVNCSSVYTFWFYPSMYILAVFIFHSIALLIAVCLVCSSVSILQLRSSRNDWMRLHIYLCVIVLILLTATSAEHHCKLFLPFFKTTILAISFVSFLPPLKYRKFPPTVVRSFSPNCTS